jgi:predicted molibdopterin-dependent oxidoreductase YjgC
MPVDLPLLDKPARHGFALQVTGRIQDAPSLVPGRAPLPSVRDSFSITRGLGLRAHQLVDIDSRRGTARGVELRVTQIIAPGQVFLPFHFCETNVNEVMQDAFDPISREPNYKQCAVRVGGQR